MRWFLTSEDFNKEGEFRVTLYRRRFDLVTVCNRGGNSLTSRAAPSSASFATRLFEAR
jgi:hypothetical protein